MNLRIVVPSQISLIELLEAITTNQDNFILVSISRLTSQEVVSLEKTSELISWEDFKTCSSSKKPLTDSFALDTIVDISIVKLLDLDKINRGLFFIKATEKGDYHSVKVSLNKKLVEDKTLKVYPNEFLSSITKKVFSGQDYLFRKLRNSNLYLEEEKVFITISLHKRTALILNGADTPPNNNLREELLRNMQTSAFENKLMLKRVSCSIAVQTILRDFRKEFLSNFNSNKVNITFSYTKEKLFLTFSKESLILFVESFLIKYLNNSFSTAEWSNRKILAPFNLLFLPHYKKDITQQDYYYTLEVLTQFTEVLLNKIFNKESL